MTLTVRLSDRLEQTLAEYCIACGVSKSEAVKRALEDLLMPGQAAAKSQHKTAHPFIGCDQGDGADVSGNIKAALRARFRKNRR
jgi:hypothetical protein